MKRVFAIILAISIALCIGITVNNITLKNDAYQFVEELKALDGEVENRLIVGADKQIDYLNADSAATGIEGLYVLQFPDAVSAKTAYEYYDALPYVRYVEYDSVCEDSFCSTEGGYDFTPNCPSTVTSNIDDAIKLIHKVKGDDLPEIRIGILDSGIKRTSVTNSRIDGGNTFLEDYSSDGTQLVNGNVNTQHGTYVAGTIIQNTLKNIRIYSYQVVNSNGNVVYSNVLASIYLAVEEQCKIISMSFGLNILNSDTLNEAINYATQQGCICVASAGNEGTTVQASNNYPALCANTITVGATDSNRRLASYTNYGNLIDIYVTGSSLISYNSYGQEIDWSGTSAAAPVISSICALLSEVKADITVDEIKSLLLETGIPTNEEEITETNRYIADAYECVKSLTEQELEKTDLQFEQSGSTITFHSDDENAFVYYFNHLGGSIQIPFREEVGIREYQGAFDEPINLNRYVVIACAYSPGKAKSKIELLKAPIYNYEYGYLINEANDTQQYNKFSRCEIVDETVMVVPDTINGIEVQEIGDYCYMGNQTVETIILPDTVKQIDAYAFANCPNLKKVIAPGVEYCGRYAFYDCPNLHYVEMPQVTLANTAMFKNCTSLSCLDIGELNTVCNHAFKNCSIDLTDTDHHYEIVGYESVENDTLITLRCSKCGEEMQVSFMEHINTDYDPLDMNNDNIVNAKDLAYIVKRA